MKRFRFTLEALERVKNSEKTQQETLLVNTQRRLDALCDRMEELREAFRTHSLRFARRLDRGVSGEEIREYNNYSTYLRESMEQLGQKIRETTKERDACRDALVRIMQELRTLDKLRNQQFKKYLEEVRREEEKSIGDFVAYQVTSA